MTQRKPITNTQNRFFDSEQISADNLTLEQNYNNSIQAAIINNQVGSGILPDVLNPRVLFDSSLVSGLLDGMNVAAQHQPSDTNFGNQLAISLTNSQVAGQKTVKIAIIGLDFNGNLQYDTFVFKINETQYTKKHYVSILTILFNDFIGTNAQSFNLGGQVVISEAPPFTVSRDPIMTAQDVQPNLFFRDFFIAGPQTLEMLLAAGLPLYNVDNLNIMTDIKENQILAANDVTTQIGEKFLATTNNIQKISLLLSVQNTAPNQATNLVWHGDLIISVYALQSSVNCITDIVPNLPIEFSPFNIPLAQLSYNYTTLQARGITLDGTPQPVDFIFSNTPLAGGNAIIPNNFYVVTVKRSGAADQCDILLAAGANQSSNSRVTTFTGTNWVDIPEDDLWYQVYTDAVTVSDGQAYDNGQGLVIPKTIINATTASVQDYALENIPFSGTSNATYTAVLTSQLQQTGVVQDQRTGDNVFSQQQYVPNVELLNVIDFQNLTASTEPLTIGTVNDKNVKSINSTLSTILASFHAWTFIGNTITLKLIDDTTDVRYDPNVLALVSYLTQGILVNAKLITDLTAPNQYYRIAKAELLSMIYGDLNGDGVVDMNDLNLVTPLVGANLNVSPPLNSQIVTNGITTTVTNGYTALTNGFVAGSGISFQVVNPITTNVMASGTDGILVVDPNNIASATFESASINFGLITNIANFNLVITAAGSYSNIGGFKINTIDPTSNHVVDISKLYITPAAIQQIFRADINGDFQVTAADSELIQNYINKVPPFPTSSLPASKIGTAFNVLQLTVDPFTFLDTAQTITNRTDDYPATATNRSAALHTTQDIFINDGYIQNHNFLSQPLAFNIQPQFTWEDYLITTNGIGRFVPTIFSAETGLMAPQCMVPGITTELYSDPPPFDPGVINSFIPNNLIIGPGGEIQNTDGSNYKIDMELGTITLEIPTTFDGYERYIDVFHNFVASYNGTPVTVMGFPAMKFADCTLVTASAIFNNQVRFATAVQSFYPNINGLDPDGYQGIIVDDRIGVYMNQSTGILTLDFANLSQDPVLRTLNTKIQITVYLKKGGFNNMPLFIDSTKLDNMLLSQ